MRRFLSVLFLSTTCIAQTNSTPAILTNSEGERYDLKFGTAIMKVTSVQTGGTWSMVDFTASPGVQTMLHRHPKTDETFFVLEGGLTMYIDGKMSTLHHGDMAYVPKMTPHAFANLSDQPLRFLGTFTPSGFEKFFALDAEASRAHAPETPEYAAASRKSTSRLITSLLALRPSASPDLRLTNWTANLTPNLLLARRVSWPINNRAKRGKRILTFKSRLPALWHVKAPII